MAIQSLVTASLSLSLMPTRWPWPRGAGTPRRPPLPDDDDDDDDEIVVRRRWKPRGEQRKRCRESAYPGRLEGVDLGLEEIADDDDPPVGHPRERGDGAVLPLLQQRRTVEFVDSHMRRAKDDQRL